MPIYKITAKLAPAKADAVEVVQLIHAANQASAIRHAALGIISAEVCSVDEAVKLGAQGVQVESA